ncbi:MAG: acyltransferase family protein [Methylophaga sp.]
MEHLPSKVPFREDINGLRAWAVLAVVFYHLPFAYQLPGGFAGVDIFFVISGFLMTSIILGGNQSGHFSIARFYMSRVRRILPALLFLVVVLLVMGWFWLATPDYQNLSEEAAAALGFVSNIHYWDNAGYFDTSAVEKWLLHSWTLSVEAQFYFLYPLLLVAIKKLTASQKALWTVLLITFLASLLLNIIVVHFYPIPTFFLLPSRGWELLAGGLVYLTPRIWPAIARYQDKQSLFYLAWTLILCSLLFLNEDLLWPGYWAVMPVLGAALVIFVSKQQSIFTNHMIFQWLGDRSYSLYLWHWPAIVLLFFMSLQDSNIAIVLALLVSVLMAHFSYQVIETPTRKIFSGLPLKKEVSVIFAVTIMLITLAVYLSNNPVAGRIDHHIDEIASQANNKNPVECRRIDAFNAEMPSCIYGDSNDIGAIVVGDSHSTAQVTGIAEAAGKYGYSVAHYYHDSCPTLSGVMLADWLRNYPNDKCANFVSWVKAELEQYPKHIPMIIINRFSFIFGSSIDKKPAVYFDNVYERNDLPGFHEEVSNAIVETFCSFSAERPVFVLKPTPEQNHQVAKEASRELLFYDQISEYAITREDYYNENSTVLKALQRSYGKCDVTILDPIPYLCDNGVCPGMINGLPITSDEDHFNEYGNKLLVPLFEQVFKAD